VRRTNALHHGSSAETSEPPAKPSAKTKLLRRRDVEAEEERPHRHQEQLAAIGFLRRRAVLHGRRAELALGQQRADRGRHHLDRGLADPFVGRRIERDRPEQQEKRQAHHGGGAERDQRVEHVVAPAPGALEADVARQEHQKRQRADEQREKPRRAEIEAELPQLHRHQHR
jgi:hypothetical protein